MTSSTAPSSTTNTEVVPIGYRAAHARVTAARGQASQWPCEDCMQPAEHWSYNHADPDELHATDRANLGAAYSLDPGHYSPRCRGCHTAYDKAQARLRRGEAMAVPEGLEARRWGGEVSWDLRGVYRRFCGLPDDPATDLRELLGSFITAQEDGDLDLVTLWILATHLAAHGVGHAIPRLKVVAPSYGAGKTTLLEFIARLSRDGEVISSTVTNALLPRIFQGQGYSTLCFDEADKTVRAENDNAMAVLNAGWQRGGVARLNDPNDKSWNAGKIDVFAPVAMAGNGIRLPADVEQRTITGRLERNENAPEARWHDELSGVDDRLRARIAAWAEDVSQDRGVRRPALPAGLGGRDRDRWEILLSAAAAIGGDWPARAGAMALADKGAREAAQAANGTAPNEQLVYDLFAIWPDAEEFVGSGKLCDLLAAYNPQTWGMPSGKLLTARSLAGRLGTFYAIQPVRIGSGSTDTGKVRGYSREQLTKAWIQRGLQRE